MQVRGVRGSSQASDVKFRCRRCFYCPFVFTLVLVLLPVFCSSLRVCFHYLPVFTHVFLLPAFSRDFVDNPFCLFFFRLVFFYPCFIQKNTCFQILFDFWGLGPEKSDPARNPMPDTPMFVEIRALGATVVPDSRCFFWAWFTRRFLFLFPVAFPRFPCSAMVYPC